MVVDYERVLLKLKAKIAEKPSHSARELYEAIGRLEVECEIPEDQEGFDDRPRRRPVNVLEAQNDDTSPSNGKPAEARV